VTVKRAIKVDTITFFDVDNDCGCVDGIGAIFGESK